METEVSEQVLEATKESVYEDIKEYIHKGGRESDDGGIDRVFGSGYFNNWYTNLPGNWHQQWAESNEETLNRKLLGEEKEWYEGGIHNSDLAKSQTSREFYAAINQAIKDSGTDFDRIKELSEKMVEQDKIQFPRRDPEFSNSASIRELERLALPAYIRLIAMGYKPYDLTA